MREISSAINKQLKKGTLDILALFLLRDRELYGYQIINELKTKSHQYFSLKEGTLYPVLYRLEDQKLIESYWDKPDGKRKAPKKYYVITNDGKLALKEMMNEWLEFAYNVNIMLA